MESIKRFFTLNDLHEYLATHDGSFDPEAIKKLLRKFIYIVGCIFYIRIICDGQILLKEITKRELKELLNLPVPVEVEEMKLINKTLQKVVAVKNLNVCSFFTTPECINQLERFDNVRLLSDNSRVLALWNPPLPQYFLNPLVYEVETARDYKNLLFDANLYVSAAIDSILTLRHYLLNPNDKPARWSIKYSPKEEGGNTGKSFYDEIIKRTLNGSAMLGCSPHLIEDDKFNDYNETYLYCSFDEAENQSTNHYDFNKFSCNMKRLTNKSGCIRGMRKTARDGVIYPLWSINTNINSLYGLVNSRDGALMRRINIMWFKKNDKTNKERAEIRKKYLLNPNMGYSFYRYITEEFAKEYPEESENYDPENYQHEDKETILKILRENNKGPVENFLNQLVDIDERDYKEPDVMNLRDEPKFNLLQHYKPNSNRNAEPFKYIIISDFKREFSKWYKSENAGRGFKNLSNIIKSELERLGWSDKDKRVYNRTIKCYSKPEESEENNEENNKDEIITESSDDDDFDRMAI
jgi:hypothetical protein